MQSNAVSQPHTVQLTMVDKSGSPQQIQAEVGQTLMEAATAHGVDGIDGDCGGCCACGTCCMRFPAEVSERIGPPHGEEQAVLDFVGTEGAHRRLGCQVPVSAELEGITIVVATA